MNGRVANEITLKFAFNYRSIATVRRNQNNAERLLLRLRVNFDKSSRRWFWVSCWELYGTPIRHVFIPIILNYNFNLTICDGEQKEARKIAKKGVPNAYV